MYENTDFENNDGEILKTPVKNDMDALHEFTNDLSIVDVTQRLKYNSNGVIVFNFGKYIGQPAAEILSKDKQYYNWILNKEFSHQVKKIVKKLVKDYEAK